MEVKVDPEQQAMLKRESSRLRSFAARLGKHKHQASSANLGTHSTSMIHRHARSPSSPIRPTSILLPPLAVTATCVRVHRRSKPIVAATPPPVHKTLGPWLREYCVAKQTAAVLTAHKCTLSVLKTITDDQLRAMGVVSLKHRLDLYQSMWLGRRSIEAAPACENPPEIPADAPAAAAPEAAPEQETEQEQEQSTVCCQNLIRSSMAARFFLDRKSARHQAVEKLVTILGDAERTFSLYDAVVARPLMALQPQTPASPAVPTPTAVQPPPLPRAPSPSPPPSPSAASAAAPPAAQPAEAAAAEETGCEGDPFATCVALVAVWQEMRAALEAQLREWCWTRCPGKALLNDVDVEWWCSVFLHHQFTRGQAACRIDALRAKGGRKEAALWERASREFAASGCRDTDVATLPYTAPRRWLSAFHDQLVVLRAATCYDHDDFAPVCMLLARTRALLDADDRSARSDAEYRAKYAALQKLAATVTGAPRGLVAWQRELVCTGKLIRVRPEVPETKREHRAAFDYMLFNDLLLLGKRGAGGGLRCKEAYELRDARGMGSVPDGTTLGAGLVASHLWTLQLAGDNTVYFQAISEHEKSDGVGRFTRVVDALRERTARARAELATIRAGLATK